MSDTKQRIAEYKQLLPGLKERIVAVALLLVISLTMVTTTTFAWVVLSRSPEVTGVTTNIASNGNLEIALATGDGKTAPGESKVGDSSASENQSIVGANVTWGNMINLNDPAYGLDNLVLRPAQLNTASLLDSPLYGAVYGEDGRITQLSTNFAYASWISPTDEKPGYFEVSDKLGVRAISSTKIEAVDAEAKYVNMVSAAKNQNLAAANAYAALANNTSYMQSLATMMGLYMTARMNPDDATLSNPDCAVADIQNLRDMYAAFLKCFDQEAEAMAALVNLTLFLQYGDGNTPYTKEDIYGTTTAELKANGIQITSLDQFKKDRTTIATDLEKLKTIASSGTSLKWKDSGLNDIVNNLVNVGACTIGKDNTPISSIGASNAANYISGTQEARITNGILYRFEERTGGYIEVKNLEISAKVKRLGITIPATVKANIQTTAPRDYNLFTNDLTFAESLNDGNYKGGIEVAQDTFGLAVDFWVRTNAAYHGLVLEGNLLTEREEVRATGKDPNGNTVELFTLTISGEDEEGNSGSYTVDLYQLTENNVTTWYNADTHTKVTEEDLGGNTPVPKMETVITVVGYEGENRVWNGEGYSTILSTDNTTQGAGSCYVYYADTPEDQARSLKLLEAMNVAFVDDKGKLMASAIMDTEHFYANNGKVIVPLVLDPGNSVNFGTDDTSGEPIYAITALEQNVATRITAIVYLDGTKLTNDMVLAAADIQGQLNIQFGATPSLSGMENEDLMSKVLTVSASVDQASFDYDTATEPMTTNVTVHVDGDAPSTVEAFFLRAISDTQGSREEMMTFTKNADGDWVAPYTFKVPGKYVLRSVRLDGVEYDLKEPPVVKVAGFAVASLSCTQATDNHITVMTADGSHPVDLTLRFAADDEKKLPKTVQGRFLHDEDGSAVNINFTYNATTGLWSGRATFLTSGDYTMQYLVLDGEYSELDSELWQTASVTLGMRVAVYTTSPHNFKYLGEEMAENQKLLGMQVVIMDNEGNEIGGLQGVKLIYSMAGSISRTMDTDADINEDGKPDGAPWNGSYYVGTFDAITAGPGIWKFARVTVTINEKVNTITTATTSPTFTIMSPEPPEYSDHITVANQFRPNNDATMNAQITNSAAATVQAYIIKTGAAEGVWVDGTIGSPITTTDGKSANHWNFKVPTDAGGNQQGTWTLTQLKLWNVFSADGDQYTEEAPLILDVPAGNTTTVSTSISVSFGENGQNQSFGKDAAGNVTATFMTSHTFEGLFVDITDGAKAPLLDADGNLMVSNVILVLAYTSGTSETYGGYKSDALSNATEGATISVRFKPDSTNNTRFVQDAYYLGDALSPTQVEWISGAAPIQFAGKYETGTLEITVGTTTYTYKGTKDNNTENTKALPANAPVLEVWSKAPTVKVSSINPASGTTYRVYSVSNPDTESQLLTGDFFKKSDYSAVVYLYTPLNNALTVTEPEVTLSLTGIPLDAKASMVFSTSNTNSVNSTFTFGNVNNALAATTTVGKATDGSSAWSGTTYPVLYPAGKMEQNTITVEYGGITYTVSLSDTVTIEQPQAPAAVEYVGIPDTYTGTKPPEVMGDGAMVTVTLPQLTWTATSEEAADNSATWSAYTAVETISDGKVYGYKNYKTRDFLIITTEHRDYQYYEWTKFQSSYTGVINVYEQEMQINQWIINGKTYNAGQTITLTGEGKFMATAVVTSVGEKKLVNTIEQTSYKYLYGYVKGEEVKDAELAGNFSHTPSGTKIGNTVTSSSGAYPSTKIADPTKANANTGTIGTNMTENSSDYQQFWP
ncbi:MAG: hypothetical protein IJA91_04815 [Clostridia bacterium]|nr:hypothetical protein [Clostridia bacterium]